MIPSVLRRNARCSTVLPLALLAMLLLGCAGNSSQGQAAPPPSPTPVLQQGQQLLMKTGRMLTEAKTLHGLFKLSATGQNMNGTIDSEVWNADSTKNRSEVRQSSVSQVSSGSITVTDGKTLWEYDPAKNVVYTGAVPANGNGVPVSSGGQSQFLVTLIQTIFTHSDATLQSSSATALGHAVYDLHVVPQGGVSTPTRSASPVTTSGSAPTNFDYDGEMYLDKQTHLPVKMDLNIQGAGK